mgnify:CR=1 FL=1
MIGNRQCGIRVSRMPAMATAGAALARLRAVLAAYRARLRRRARLRCELARLDDRLLHDAGLRRDDLEREARRPFWRP